MDITAGEDGPPVGSVITTVPFCGRSFRTIAQQRTCFSKKFSHRLLTQSREILSANTITRKPTPIRIVPAVSAGANCFVASQASKTAKEIVVRQCICGELYLYVQCASGTAKRNPSDVKTGLVQATPKLIR